MRRAPRGIGGSPRNSAVRSLWKGAAPVSDLKPPSNFTQSADRRRFGRRRFGRRRFGRRRMVWHAWIVTPGPRRTACTVRNVSSGGALLELDVPAWLPHEFMLCLEDSAMSALCDVRHRGRHGVGISFRHAAEGLALARLAGTRGETARFVPKAPPHPRYAAPPIAAARRLRSFRVGSFEVARNCRQITASASSGL
jgi:hypothetical protein